MALDLVNISDTISGVTQTYGAPVPSSIKTEISDKKNRNRTIIRIVIGLVILAIIASLVYFTK